MSVVRQTVRINGWQIYVHELFWNQYLKLREEVEALKQKKPETYQTEKAVKMLAAIHKLAFEVIPSDPSLDIYRQGNTLGSEYKHWFRAKFFQQYRLFFRYSAQEKIIVYAWVNDDKTKRAYGSKTDAYAVFTAMLKNGNPPDSWEALKKVSENIAFGL